MEVLLYLIPTAIGMGLLGLLAFLWALRSGQFEDLDGAAERILFDEEDEPFGHQHPAGDSPDRLGGGGEQRF